MPAGTESLYLAEDGGFMVDMSSFAQPMFYIHD